MSTEADRILRLLDAVLEPGGSGDANFSVAVLSADGEVIATANVSEYRHVAMLTCALEDAGYAWLRHGEDAESVIERFDLVFAPVGSDLTKPTPPYSGVAVSSQSAVVFGASIDDYFRSVARQLPAGAAFVVGTDLRYRLAEGKSLDAHGMRPDMFEGKHILEFVPPPMAQEAQRDYELALAGGTFYREHPVGSRWYSTQGVPLRDETGEVYAALAVSYDITHLKQVEAELRDSETALKEVCRRKDVFLATLAHELRNPLAPISVGVELLAHLPLGSAKADRTLAMVKKQVGQITRLVNDLVDLAKVSEGKLTVSLQPVVVQEVVEIACDEVRPMMEAQRHHFEVSTPRTPVALKADPARLAQILVNLLGNAAKFTPPGGLIELKVEEDDGGVRFVVRDSGPGIPSDKLSAIFEMFAQLGTQVNYDAAAGLGIGLALVRRLTEKHGGTVTVQSDGPGTGSTFTVVIPKA